MKDPWETAEARVRRMVAQNMTPRPIARIVAANRAPTEPAEEMTVEALMGPLPSIARMEALGLFSLPPGPIYGRGTPLPHPLLKTRT